MRFTDDLLNYWDANFIAALGTFNANTVDTQFPRQLRDPRFRRLIDFFQLAFIDNTMSIEEWNELGFADYQLMGIFAIANARQGEVFGGSVECYFDNLEFTFIASLTSI